MKCVSGRWALEGPWALGGDLQATRDNAEARWGDEAWGCVLWGGDAEATQSRGRLNREDLHGRRDRSRSRRRTRGEITPWPRHPAVAPPQDALNVVKLGPQQAAGPPLQGILVAASVTAKSMPRVSTPWPKVVTL